MPDTGFSDPITGAAVTTDPFTGKKLPNAGAVVKLGIVGAASPLADSKGYSTFDVFNTAWSLFLPPVESAGGISPAGVGEPFGLRNVQGLFNNISLSSAAIWGAAFYAFARNSAADYSNYIGQRLDNPAYDARRKASFIEQTFVNNLDGLGTPGTEKRWGEMLRVEKALVQDSTYGVRVDNNGNVDLSQRYANPFLTVYDYTPRMISQLVDSNDALLRIEAAGGGVITDNATYRITDVATGQLVDGGRVFEENFSRNLNTLGGDPSLTGWNVLFGQFFDHGLDFIGKGGNTTLFPGADGVFGTADDRNVSAKVYIPLATDDPLYRAPGTFSAQDPGYTKLSISRANVANPEAAGLDGMFQTADDIASPGADGVYGTSDDIFGATNPNYVNHTSPYIDQSQTYGSDDNVTNMLREWVLDPATGKYVPSMYLLDGNTLEQSWNRQNPDGTLTVTNRTLPTLNELRSHLLETGRSDLTWADLDNLRVRDETTGKVLDLDPATAGIQAKLSGHTLLADFLPRLDAAHLFNSQTVKDLIAANGGVDVLSGFDGVNRGNASGGKYVSDYVDLQSGQPTALGTQSASGGILNEILLRSVGDHYIAGDGRANENFGLTAVHHVWHEDHNWQIDNLINIIGQQQAADPNHAIAHAWQVNTGNLDANNNYVYRNGAIAWDQEKMFQASVAIVQTEYQHVAIDQYARGMSPNIPLFVAYEPQIFQRDEP